MYGLLTLSCFVVLFSIHIYFASSLNYTYRGKPGVFPRYVLLKDATFLANKFSASKTGPNNCMANFRPFSYAYTLQLAMGLKSASKLIMFDE
jgi:hypothetical protein